MESKWSLLATISNYLIDLIFPKICVSCGQPNENLCNYCKQSVNPVFGTKSVPNIDQLIFIWRYDNQVVKSLIKSLKYDFITSLENDLRFLFNQQNYIEKIRDFCSSGYLIPIPLHKKRELWRGFNQSVIIAQIISEITCLPVKDNLIKRIIFTKQQAHLELNDRLLNLKNVFLATKCSTIDKTAILIDDVVTTGATLSAAAQELKRKGFLYVKALVLAA